MITAVELKERLKKNVEMIPDKNPGTILQSIIENLQYGQQRYEELDEDGKKLVDRQFDLLTKMADALVVQIRSQPDSLNKRKVLREHKKTQGKHFNITDLLASLDEPSQSMNNVDDRSEELFITSVQIALDYLSDVTDAKLKTRDSILLGLFYSAIDELVVAFHLAKHKYAPQSINQSRSVLEILDKAELFYSKPEQIAMWADSTNWREFQPGRVREKLGKPNHDEIYSGLSEVGTHITFKYIQSKVSQNIQPEKKLLTVKINVGGSDSEHNVGYAYTTCIYVTNLLIIQIGSIYKEFLFRPETEDNSSKLKEMGIKYYKDIGVDTTGLT